jgi:hypothetical protein
MTTLATSLQIRKEIDSSFDLIVNLLNERRNVLLSSLEIEQRGRNDEEGPHHLSFTLDLDSIKKVISSSGELTRSGPVASRCSLTLTGSKRGKEGKEVERFLLVHRRTPLLLHLRDANGEPFSSSSSSDLKKLISLSLIQEKEEKHIPIEFEIESDGEVPSNGSHLIPFTPSQEGIPSSSSSRPHLFSSLLTSPPPHPPSSFSSSLHSFSLLHSRQVPSFWMFG